MPSHARWRLVVVVDRYFLLGTLGVILAIFFAAGEFLGWWDQLGRP